MVMSPSASAFNLGPDLSLSLAPSYTREGSFGLGATVTGLFRTAPNDTLLQSSLVFGVLSVTLNKFYTLGSRGELYLPGGRSRMSYVFDVYRKPLHFWGVRSNLTSSLPKSYYDRRCAALTTEYLYATSAHFFVGAALNADLTAAASLEDPAYLDGEPHRIFVTGIGPAASYDTRDNAHSPASGIMVTMRVMVYPALTGDYGRSFYSFRVIADAYRRLWRGAVVAADLYCKINSRSTPWSMREYSGADGRRLRGYYYGSTVERSLASAQIELRQRVWDRIGIAVWGGMAAMFASVDRHSTDWRGCTWLPDWGAGLRLQIRPQLNARIDVGFGKHSSGVMFAVGESF